MSGDWPGAEDWTGLSNDLRFPAIRLAVAAAIIFVANAHLSRTFIAFGRWMLVLGAGGAVLPGHDDHRRHRRRRPHRPGGGRSGAPRARARLRGCRASKTSRMHSPTSASARTISRRTSASRPGSSARTRRMRAAGARDQGLRPRRLRQPDAREVLAHALVPGRRRGSRTQPGAGSRARGAPHAARRARRRADRRGRDGRRHARRRLAARAARAGADARGARRRRSTMRYWARSGRQSTRSAGPTSPTARSTRPHCASATAQSRSSISATGSSRRAPTSA